MLENFVKSDVDFRGGEETILACREKVEETTVVKSKKEWDEKEYHRVKNNGIE